MSRAHSWLRRKAPLLFALHTTPRILLFFIAVVIQLAASALSAMGFVLNDGALMIAGTVVWLFWFAVLFMIAVPATDQFLQKHLHRLKRAALTIFIVLLLLGIGEVVFTQTSGAGKESSQLLTAFDRLFVYNDATALCHQATDNFIAGENPYAKPNVVMAMKEFEGGYDETTPLRQGRFANVFPYPTPEQLDEVWRDALKNPEQVPPELESRLSYPAGCFLLPTPFILAGLNDIRVVYLIYVLPALLYVIFRAPRNLKFLFLGALLISLVLPNSMAMGETGSLYFPFMLLAWILPRRNLWMSALFMGLAVATKQVAWFLVPFYLILIFRIMGIKRATQVVAIIAVVFVAFNAPFIASDPEVWWASIMAPMSDPMFPLGIGIINFVSAGVLDVRSPFIFGVTEFCVAGLAIVWYFRNCCRYPHTGPILAILPLFFAWRSLWPYFFYSDIVVLAAIVMDEYAFNSGSSALKASLDGSPLRRAQVP